MVSQASSAVLSPVTRIIIFLTLAITLVASTGHWRWVVMGWSAVLLVLLGRVLLENWRLVAASCLWLAMVVALALLLGYRPGLEELTLELLKLSAFVAATIVVFASLNAFEFTAALTTLGVPVRLALAVGTGLRFIPAFVEDIADIVVELRSRSAPTNQKPGRMRRLVAAAERFIIPLVVNALRTMEAITISAAVHEIEPRVRDYRLPRLSIFDYVFVCIAITTCVVVLIAAVLAR